jgi:hypothetical protein
LKLAVLALVAGGGGGMKIAVLLRGNSDSDKVENEDE